MQDDIKARIERDIEGASVNVLADGNRVEIHVVSAAFEGLSRVKKQ